MDRIHITDLALRTIIGLNPEERRKLQDVLINITLEADLGPAGTSDAVADTVNYRTLTKRVIRLVEASRFYLVEKLAQEIAWLALEDERVQQVWVRVEKPGALRFARSVGVELSRTRADLPPRHYAFITLGSNLSPELNLRAAVQLLAGQCAVLDVSPIYETEPVGTQPQPRYLNAAVRLATPLTAEQLKAEVLTPIENALHRQRSADKFAPRTIDLDIALFDTAVLQLGSRAIPDPDILRYAHVAVPLADLAPDYRHPLTGQTLRQIAAALPQTGLVRLEEEL